VKALHQRKVSPSTDSRFGAIARGAPSLLSDVPWSRLSIQQWNVFVDCGFRNRLKHGVDVRKVGV
jgi:hypothetical protein